MDSLEEFEKALAAEKAERERAAQEKEDRRERRHRHHNHRCEPSSERHRTSDRHRHRHRDSRDKDERRDRDDERNRRRHHRSRDDSDEDDHRHKRSRHSRDEGEEEGRHGRGHRSRDHSRDRRRDGRGRRSPMDIKDLKQSDPKEDLPLPDEERAPTDPNRPVRDSWMTAPSALDIDYIHRGAKRRSPSPAKEEPQRVLHKRELNVRLGELEKREQELELPVEPDVNYEFGDEGSQWRMTKLKAVYTIAEQTGRPVDDVAVERYGNLREFDDAREEKMEMDRRRVYGEGYVGKEKPTGDLYAERMARTRPEPQRSPPPQPTQGLVIEDMIKPAPPMDQSALNRMRAQLMKAKLRNAPEAAKLEEEYNAAMAAFSTGAASNNAVVLDASHSRMLAGARAEVKAVTNKRGLERGQVEANEDMSLEDMIREERRTRGQPGGEGRRLAERIAKDGRFDNDLDYLDENAEKLAKRVHRSDAALKNMAVTEYKKLNRILDACPLCFHEDRAPPQNQPLAPVVSLGTRTYLTLPTAPELTGAEGGAVAVPLSHHTNLLECDDDEWEELRNFMKSLTRLYHDQGRDVLFYENAASPQRRPHAALVAVPIPYELGDTAPAFFREAMLAADEEWAQHRKVIDTARKARDEGLGRLAFRRSLAKEMPYFHVWFNLDGGLAHVVEDADRWPKGDLFAREVIGGMLDTEPDVIKRQGRWTRNDDRVDGFKKRWRKFDWTRVLAEEG